MAVTVLAAPSELPHGHSCFLPNPAVTVVLQSSRPYIVPRTSQDTDISQELNSFTPSANHFGQPVAVNPAPSHQTSDIQPEHEDGLLDDFHACYRYNQTMIAMIRVPDLVTTIDAQIVRRPVHKQ